MKESALKLAPIGSPQIRSEGVRPSPSDQSSERPAPVPLVIIGADAYLAARPATPVQVDHACRAAGYAAAIPATWGDELLATACAERLATRTVPSGIFCACQRVRDRLLGPGPDLLPFLVSFVAPPIATARYVQQLYGDVSLDITYVGNCPSANSDPAIARQVRPEDFFASLTARGIVAAREPLVFNSFFAPDRRRCVSLPGGLPIDRVLQEPADGSAGESEETGSPLPLVPRSVVSIRDVEYAAELAQYLLMAAPVLLDVAPRLGCACSGAVSGVAVADARAAVMALEPPRSPGPVIEASIKVDLNFEPRVEEPPKPRPADVPVPKREIDLDADWYLDAPPAIDPPASAGPSQPARSEPAATRAASWLASFALAVSDQDQTELTLPPSSRSAPAADRGAGIP